MRNMSSVTERLFFYWYKTNSQPKYKVDTGNLFDWEMIQFLVQKIIINGAYV